MQVSFEDALAKQMLFHRNEDKSFIDKLTAKEDVLRMRELHKKTKIERTEVMEMLQLMVGNESKLLNFDDFERYVFGRYFIKIREGFSIDEKLWVLFEELTKKCKDPEIISLWKENLEMVNSTSKFFVDNFQWLTRSGMSVGGIGFDKILKNRFELAYPTEKPTEQKKGILSSVFGGGGGKN